MMVRAVFVSLLFLLSACAGAPTHFARHAASALTLGPVETVRGNSSACAGDADSPCLVPWQKALDLCKVKGAHLPTARDYAAVMQNAGVKILEPAQVDAGKVPAGFYEVESLNPDGTKDAFYANFSGYVRPADLKVFHHLWTASTPPDHLQYAHVYYDEWGGGGGPPEEHFKEHLNSFQCAEGN